MAWGAVRGPDFVAEPPSNSDNAPGSELEEAPSAAASAALGMGAVSRLSCNDFQSSERVSQRVAYI